MPQARECPGPVVVVVVMTGFVVVTVTVVVTVLLLGTVLLLATVLVLVLVLVGMIVVRAAHAVHDLSMRGKTHCRTSTRTTGAQLRTERMPIGSPVLGRPETLAPAWHMCPMCAMWRMSDYAPFREVAVNVKTLYKRKTLRSM
jgi:hypothetical protein